ncbi:MAG: DUF4886 domain-containing protein [Clostridia bacterium]|nr:DUF4886 domain-containing protein [Clostridia bacterium]
MKMLSIGNSFSCDALAYFRDIAKEAGIDVEVWHMAIGGCSLERHYNNMKADMPAYNFLVNEEHRPNASLAQVIEKEEFDLVTVQQVSHSSGLYSTFHPYIDEFVAYIRKHQPKAKLWLHKTWAYEKDSGHSGFNNYCKNQQLMYNAICSVYERVAKEISADGIIPSGDVIQSLRNEPEFNYPQEPSLCRDGFHMHLLYGRYAVAATWFETLLKGDIREISFLPPEEIVGKLGEGALRRIELIKKIVHEICTK